MTCLLRWCNRCGMNRAVNTAGQSYHCQNINCEIGNGAAREQWVTEPKDSRDIPSRIAERQLAAYGAAPELRGDPYQRIADYCARDVKIVEVMERFREHPLDRLTDRVWAAMIRVAIFLGKFFIAATLGTILGRLAG